MNVMSAIKNELDYSDRSVTENGAVGYKTTGKRLLDLNFATSSLRHSPDEEITRMFDDALDEDEELAMRWLFFARDVRGGMGERRIFRVITKWLAETYPSLLKPVLQFIPEYGRWDDVIALLDSSVGKQVERQISEQFNVDYTECNQGGSISLLAKWLPSENASSQKTRATATKIRRMLGLPSREYRKTLSDLRKRIGIVERQMSAKQWDKINYEAVPSRANLIYEEAFMRHDSVRRGIYLDALKNGKAKINASTLFPHDIVHKYDCVGAYWGNSRRIAIDDTIEALWSALPNTLTKQQSTIVVADGSGSMTYRIGNTEIQALEVADALAIYFAERLNGVYKNKYITFSSKPQFVDLTGCSTLRDKLVEANKHTEVSNTNIEAVFDLILKAAVRNHMSAEDMPNNVLIISDMEFDNATNFATYHSFGQGQTLFDTINTRYRKAGYRMPRLVFWNVSSRTGTIPMRENENGVALVSGFSPNIAKMVMSGKTDPYECLVETLMNKRYNPIGEQIRNVCYLPF